MTFELSSEDAALVREFVQDRLIELEKEINRTDNMAFREDLRRMERALERLLGQLTQRMSAS